ncbi:MAG: OmpA family protein, partial [Candidatus Sedimenticola sp. 4PFRAG1]
MWRWILLFIAPTAFAVEMGVREFSADLHQAKWDFSGTPMVCTLKHEIPGFGMAQFQQRAGKPLSFSVELVKRNKQEGMAQLKEMPPAWVHGARTAEPVEIALTKGKKPFSVDAHQSEWLLDTLERGWGCAVEYPDEGRAGGLIRGVVSPVKFQKKFSDYQACIKKLLPYTLEDVRFKVFQYQSKQMNPSAKMKMALDRIAQFVMASPEKYIINIHGHTDSIGSRSSNRKVSDKRANGVAAYLAGKGVPGGQLATKAYGESRPRVSNRTAKVQGDPGRPALDAVRSAEEL